MEKKRDMFADYLKGGLIILVVWGHVIQLLRSSDGLFWDDYIYKGIYMFHMPLFIAVSGYYTNISLSKKSAIIFLKERILYLLVPLILWGSFEGVTDIVFSKQEVSNKPFYIYASIISSYWFIWVTLIHSIIMGCLKMVKLNNKYIIGFLGLVSMLVPAFWNNITLIFAKDMFCFFVIGYLLAIFDVEKVYSFCKKYFVVFLSLSVLCYIVWSREALIYYTPADIFHLKFSMLRFISGIVASICFILTIRFIYDKFTENTKFLAVLGKETLGIYLIQGFLFFLLGKIIYITPLSPIISVFLLAGVAAIMVFIYNIIRLIDKNNIVAFLLLGKKLKKKF